MTTSRMQVFRSRIVLCLPLTLCAVLILVLSGSARAAFQPEGPNSCYDCHRNLADERLSHPVTLWSKSVHAEVGNTCDGCHGGDPNDTTLNSMSKENRFYAAPKEEEIGRFCEKCHQELAGNFLTSPHGMAGAPTCIDCHGSHTIHRISIDIINPERCTQCHDYEPGEKLKNLLESLHVRFNDARDRISLIKGFPTDPLQDDLEKVWKKLRQVRMISHTFDLSLIEKEVETASASLMPITDEIRRLNELGRDRMLWGLVSVLVFFGLAILTYLYNKQNSDLD